MRAIDVAAVSFEKPGTACDQLRNAGVGSRRAFHRSDRLPQGCRQLRIQRAHQQPQTNLPARVIPMRAEQGDSAANTVMLQDQLESLARVHSLMERDFDDSIDLFTFVYLFNRRRNRSRITQSLEICPSVRDVAVRQEQVAG